MQRLLYIVSFLLLIACSKNAMPGTANPVAASVLRTVNVSNASELKAALADAQAGDDIILSDGSYKGKFVVAANADGRADAMITLRGSRNAILDAENINTGYVLYLQADYWKISGISISNGLKGIMADGIHHCLLEKIRVFNIGEEAVHLRKASTHNSLRELEISHTGLKTADYGEGIYIGSAKNNWPNYSNGLADKCDSNYVINNIIGPEVKAECIDIKEGTTGGIIRDNRFDATGITGANSGDSWIDVKGNGYLIENNRGTNPGGTIFKDGYQVHCAVQGWGNDNLFKNNYCEVNAAGYGFNIQLSGSNGTTSGNKVFSNNQVVAAASGVSNIPLSN
ncbi:MAG: coagulation factor 5/8 type protein [Ferruginibacter sp.]|nr:coagulation factor 5/8 type protein [Ferruginibacter sp.]